MQELDMEAVKTDLALAASGPARASVLVVDDDPQMLNGLRRCLGSAFDVVTYASAHEAAERVQRGGISAVLSDISMPGMSGLELLSVIRLHDPDLPVLLVTGLPSVASATKAIEYGVFRYIQKPVDARVVSAAVTQATQLYRLAQMKREALALLRAPDMRDLGAIERGLAEAFASLWMAFQPIVSFSKRAVFGYEALLRTKGGRLRAPAEVLAAAEQLGKVHELGRLVRERAASLMASSVPDPLLFINLHPSELADPALVDPSSSLAAIAPRVVLEITERASLDTVDRVRDRIAALRELGFKIAIDDLGAGYAGLASFALLEPEFVKIDMSLTRDIDRNPVKQRIVSSLNQLCHEMGMTVVVEGVETVQERDTLLELGVDVMQGYLFARPGRAFPEPRW